MILLNPGPTNTRFSVKLAQWLGSDVCHRTDEFSDDLQETKRQILNIFSKKAKMEDWEVSIIAGSGTVAMEAMISSLANPGISVLVAGKYGARALEIMSTYKILNQQLWYKTLFEVVPDRSIDNLYFVENETSTGERFPIDYMSAKFPNAKFFIDATSAFGSSVYDNVIDKINAISFCSNKCLQSTPGLGIVIWRRRLEIKDRSYYSNLSRYVGNDIPFTLPTQSVYALKKATKDFDCIKQKDLFCSRSSRLIFDMIRMGIHCINIIPSNSIIAFQHPNKTYEELKKFLLKRDIVIYSGVDKVKNSFRISTMSVKFDKKYSKILRALSDSCIR
mgnify:FL=1